ncbi:MAG: hypothetical protein AAGA77_20710 [Bacteroidota bacterium]
MNNKIINLVLFIACISFLLLENFGCLVRDGFRNLEDCYVSGFGIPRNEYVFWTEVILFLLLALFFMIGNSASRYFQVTAILYMLFFSYSFEFIMSFNNPYHFSCVILHVIGGFSLGFLLFGFSSSQRIK